MRASSKVKVTSVSVMYMFVTCVNKVDPCSSGSGRIIKSVAGYFFSNIIKSGDVLVLYVRYQGIHIPNSKMFCGLRLKTPFLLKM